MKTIYQKNYKNIFDHYREYNTSVFHYEREFELLSRIEKAVQTISQRGEHYYNPIPSIFLLKINCLKLISFYPAVFCRDGLFTLLNFFQRFPTPGSCKTIMLIKADFISYVPASWHKHIVFYEFGMFQGLNNLTLNEPCNSLIIKGLSTDFTNLNPAMVKKILEKKYDKVKILLFNRNNHFLNKDWVGDKENVHRLESFYPQLYSSLKNQTNFEFLDLDDLRQLKNYHHYKFFDIGNKNYYIGDDYIDFFLLSKGAIPDCKLENRKTGGNEIISLSPYHGYRLLKYEDIKRESLGSETTNIEIVKSKLEIKPNEELDTKFNNYILQSQTLRPVQTIMAFNAL